MNPPLLGVRRVQEPTRCLAAVVSVLDLIQAALGIALLAFLPGWAWSWFLRDQLNRIERFVVAVVLSVSIVILTVYFGDVLLGVPVRASTGIWWALAATAAGLAPRAYPWLSRAISDLVRAAPAERGDG